MELLRDRSEEFRAAGAQPYAISRDSPWTHVAWTQALDLDFPLLSDWNAEATKGFGVAFEFRGLRDVSSRSAFLIGRDGTVRGAWHYDTSEVPDFDDLLAAVRAMA
jgi:glutaredoxin-dependent peroxiredoxin